MFVFFAFIIWFWILITIFADIFRRKDTSGFSKVLWIIFVIVLPFLGVFIYLIANHDGMTERNIEKAQAQQAQMDQYVKSVAGSGGPPPGPPVLPARVLAYGSRRRVRAPGERLGRAPEDPSVPPAPLLARR